MSPRFVVLLLSSILQVATIFASNSIPGVVQTSDGFASLSGVVIPKSSEVKKPKMSGNDILNHLAGIEPSVSPTVSPTNSPTVSPTHTPTISPSSVLLFASNSSSPAIGAIPINGCEGKTSCGSGICLCMTAGTEVGFLNNVVSVSKKQTDQANIETLRQARANFKFTHLFLPMLPGCDDIKFRNLWEFVTNLVSESAVEQELGSTLNSRTGAYARNCGGLAPGATRSSDSAHEDANQCQLVRKGKGDDPALITLLQDMTMKANIVAEHIEEATLAVFIVRNPVDQYQAYLKQRVVGFETTPDESTNATSNRKLLGASKKQDKQDVRKDNTKSDQKENKKNGKKDGGENSKRDNKNDSKAFKKDTKSTKIEDLEKASSEKTEKDLGTKEKSANISTLPAASPPAYVDPSTVVPNKEFDLWFTTQWVPYVQSISTYTHKQRYVFKYEEVMEDPAGIFYDFMLSTGVGQQLGIGKRVLNALASKSLRSSDRKLIELDQTGLGFSATGGLSAFPTLAKDEALLQSFGYYYYEQSMPLASYPHDLEQASMLEAQLRNAKSSIALQVGGEIKDDEERLRIAEGRLQWFQILGIVLVAILAALLGTCAYFRKKRLTKGNNVMGLSTAKRKVDKLKRLDLKTLVSNARTMVKLEK